MLQDEENLNLDNITQYKDFFENATLFFAYGFEDRCFGLLDILNNQGINFKSIVIGKYKDTMPENETNKQKLITLQEKYKVEKIKIFENNNSNDWISKGLDLFQPNQIILDISSISSKSIIPILDLLSDTNFSVKIVYTEALKYRPDHNEYQNTKNFVFQSDPKKFSEEINKKKWLYNTHYKVEFIENHEPKISPAFNKLLISFLPWKSSRLESIFQEYEYQKKIFFAGIPHKNENRWRLEAVKEINELLIDPISPIFNIDTFGYKTTVSELKNILFDSSRLLNNYNISIALLGSKLQSLACWYITNVIKSIGIIISSPFEYHVLDFSYEIGDSWIFDLVNPKTIIDKTLDQISTELEFIIE